MLKKKIKTITIREFEYLACSKPNGSTNKKYHFIEENYFELIKNYLKILNDSKDLYVSDFFDFSLKRDVGEVITIKNYVGVITIENKLVIEILPKISDLSNDDSIEKSRDIFLKMLKESRFLKYKSSSFSNLDLKKLSIFDIFINEFIDMVFDLTKKGLKSSYNNLEENLYVLKGKLIVSENIKNNFANKTRFYVSYDEYNNNRVENRIIKTTLKYLFNYTNIDVLKQKLNVLLTLFKNIDESKNIDLDFSKCTFSRDTENYSRIINWCKMFLKGLSFASTFGSNLGNSLLFPMNKIFEVYIARLLKKNNDTYDVIVQGKDNTKFLFESSKAFRLIPDIILKKKDKDEISLIIDTKWKVVNTDENNSISQDDLYQMYVYAHKYNVNKIILLYPKSFDGNKDIQYVSKENDTYISIYIRFIDLFDINNVKNQLINIIDNVVND